MNLYFLKLSSKKLLSVVSICFIFLGFKTDNDSNKVYNVIWLDLEDLSPMLAAYGDSTIKTPNIDRLAKEGIVFANAHSCVGVCAPSRYSIVTGTYPVAHGAHNMRTGMGNKYPNAAQYEVVPPAYVRCFPDILRENGIYTSGSKTDFQFSPSPLTFDEYPKNDEVDRYQFPKQRPFYKQINFWETHESQIWDWMRVNVPLAVDTSKVKIPSYLPQTPTMKMDWATQYNNLLYCDAKIGKLLAALENHKLLESTILIFTGDHGNGLPRGKRTVYESGVKVPLIIRFPTKKMAGTSNNDLVYLMDLGPTILSMFNLSVPSYMNGRDIVGNQKPKESRKYLYFSADRFDNELDIIRAVGDGKYKYIRNYQPQKGQFLDLDFRKRQAGIREIYLLDSLGKLNVIQQAVMRKSKPSEELFDMVADKEEIKNLAELPNYESKLIELRAVLDQWQRQTKDLGFTKEQDIANQFWPKGVQPITSVPINRRIGNKIEFTQITH